MNPIPRNISSSLRRASNDVCRQGFLTKQLHQSSIRQWQDPRLKELGQLGRVIEHDYEKMLEKYGALLLLTHIHHYAFARVQH